MAVTIVDSVVVALSVGLGSFCCAGSDPCLNLYDQIGVFTL